VGFSLGEDMRKAPVLSLKQIGLRILPNVLARVDKVIK
jgi:hypothetical protein